MTYQGEDIDTSGYQDGLVTLPYYGSYQYYFSLVDYPEKISNIRGVKLVEPPPPVEVIEYDTLTIDDLIEHFSEIDADGSKKLDIGEMKIFFENLTLEKSLPSTLLLLIKVTDKNNDQKISWEELSPKEAESTFSGVQAQIKEYVPPEKD